MKYLKEYIGNSSETLIVKEEHLSEANLPLHYHHEYELTLILEGSGKRVVGDNISEFNKDDLCFFGPNLIHTYNNVHLSADRQISQIVVQFNEQFLGKGFFEKPHFKKIKIFLDRSVQGYQFHGETSKIASNEIKKLVKKEGADLVIHFLWILSLLSNSKELSTIAAVNNDKIFGQEDTERFSDVLDYIKRRYRENITLNDVSSIACLSPEAFCRYFKKCTRKTLSAFVTELRIAYACQLIQQSRLTINQVSSESGFNNITYFNRKFKEINRKTPLEYQREFTLLRNRCVVDCCDG